MAAYLGLAAGMLKTLGDVDRMLKGLNGQEASLLARERRRMAKTIHRYMRAYERFKKAPEGSTAEVPAHIIRDTDP